eukprot:gb/GEZN01001845.1/.p1 GENE.gb/GEZN01001845.1/~~gb/GEZN01001845.1/.p1  ORF type:complete len:746 (+),score=90.68 gb/GEZN01001845.1/:61-2298(+)
MEGREKEDEERTQAALVPWYLAVGDIGTDAFPEGLEFEGLRVRVRIINFMCFYLSCVCFLFIFFFAFGLQNVPSTLVASFAFFGYSGGITGAFFHRFQLGRTCLMTTFTIAPWLCAVVLGDLDTLPEAPYAAIVLAMLVHSRETQLREMVFWCVVSYAMRLTYVFGVGSVAVVWFHGPNVPPPVALLPAYLHNSLRVYLVSTWCGLSVAWILTLLAENASHFNRLQDALITESELLEKANRNALNSEKFIATMSHEIRTPINGVVGLMELMIADHEDFQRLSEKQQASIRTINTCTVQLLSIVNDILDFSKINAEMMSVSPNQICSVAETLESCIALFSATAAEKYLPISYEILPDVPAFLMTDFIRVRQCLSNLINNAIKFTEKGRIHLILRQTEPEQFQQQEEPRQNFGVRSTQRLSFLPGKSPVLTSDHRRAQRRRRKVQQLKAKSHAGIVPTWGLYEVRVIDTGCGIPIDRLDQVWKRFSQVDEKHNRASKGTGLGLAIVRKLAELLGGTVGVESSVGKQAGSTFWFSFRAKTACKAKHRKRIAGSIPGSTSSSHLQLLLAELAMLQGVSEQGDRSLFPLLVVDDNKINRMVMSNMLKKIGFPDVVTVASGEEALAQLQATGPDRAGEVSFRLVISDLHMPGMDGLELIRAARQLSIEVPFVAFSASAFDEEKRMCIDAGFSYFLAKPASIGDVEHVVSNVIRDMMKGSSSGTSSNDLTPVLFRRKLSQHEPFSITQKANV